MLNFRGCHFEKELSLLYARWYLAYPLSYRHIEEMMEGRGADVDHSNINRWVLKCTPFHLERIWKKEETPLASSWRMDETYLAVKGEGSLFTARSIKRTWR